MELGIVGFCVLSLVILFIILKANKKNETPYLQFNIREDGAFFIKVYWRVGLKGKKYDKQIENLVLLTYTLLKTVDSMFYPYVEGGIKSYGDEVNDYDTALKITKEVGELLKKGFKNPMLDPTNIFRRMGG